jgi:hypothetical protein
MKTLVLSLVFAIACGSPSKPVESGGDPKGSSGDPKGGGSGSADEECPKAECGPPIRMPNRKCPDGKTIAGPTDRCLRHADGKCGWEVIQCPGGGTTAQNNPCKPTGCSGTLCADHDMVSNCLYLPEYDCYKTARCEPQSDGKCGWTQTDELTSCIAMKKKK